VPLIPLGLQKIFKLTERDIHVKELTRIPTNDWKLAGCNGPCQRILDLLQLFELHRQSSFFDFVARKFLQVASETDVLARANEPFRWVILIPSERIPIVHRKLVMEIMISLAHGQESGDQMVTRRMLVIVRCFAEPVGYRVDGKCRLDEPFNKSCRIIK
jgi:hypothetical protein